MLGERVPVAPDGCAYSRNESAERVYPAMVLAE